MGPRSSRRLIVQHGLPLTPKEQREYREIWAEVHFGSEDPSRTQVDKALFDHIYGLLDILDNKAGSLIQFNAISVASILIFVSPKFSAENLGVLATDVTLVTATASLVGAVYSSVLCHLVIFVYWAEISDFQNPGALEQGLFETWRNRTIWYRRAWYYSMLSVLLVPIAVFTEAVVRSGVALRFPGWEWSLLAGLGLFGVAGFCLNVWDGLVLWWSGRVRSRAPA